MARRKDIIGGLSLGRTELCLAQCFADDKLIANVSIQPLEEADDYWDSARKGFLELVWEVKLQGQSVVSCLPGEQAIIKRIDLEDGEPDIDDALQWELGQQIVGSMDEYVFDYQRCKDQAGGGLQSFLVVAYRSAAVDRMSKLLRSCKLSPIVIDLDILALVNVYEANYADRLTAPAVIVYGDLARTKIVLTRDGEYVGFDVFDHDAACEAPDGYAAHVSKTMQQLVRENPGFAGTEDVFTYFSGLQFAQQEFADKVIAAAPNSEILYPFRNVACSAGMEKDSLKRYSAQLGVAVGLALRGVE